MEDGYGYTYLQARRAAGQKLRSRGVPDADLDADLLLEEASSMSRAQILLRGADQVPEDIMARYAEAVEKRSRRIPLQQITGKACFMGLDLEVSDQVLIPRQDSEILAEEAIRRIREAQEEAIGAGLSRKGPETGGRGLSQEEGPSAGASEHPGRVRVLDLCTGSACLIIAAAHFCRGIEAVASDLSDQALDIARRNVQNSGVSVSLLQGDLFESVTGTYDVILSNPPYIKEGDLPNLMEEVRDHEPRLALDGGRDGLDFYRRIISRAPEYMRPGGWLLFEIGADQGAQVGDLLHQGGFEKVSILQDLAGLDRVAEGRWRAWKVRTAEQGGSNELQRTGIN